VTGNAKPERDNWIKSFELVFPNPILGRCFLILFRDFLAKSPLRQGESTGGSGIV
jgi:hypothetical protein